MGAKASKAGLTKVYRNVRPLGDGSCRPSVRSPPGVLQGPLSPLNSQVPSPPLSLKVLPGPLLETKASHLCHVSWLALWLQWPQPHFSSP